MKSLLSALLLLLFSTVRAQEDNPLADGVKIRIGGSMGPNRHILLDRAVSPMLYSGKGTAFGSGLEIDRGTSLDRFFIAYQHAGVRPGLENGSGADLYNAQAEWVRAYRLNQAGRTVGLYAGGQFLAGMSVVDHEQWSNNGFSYCFTLSLAPGFRIDIPSPGGREYLHLKWDLSLPLIAYVVRPGISSLVPEGTIYRGDLDIWGYALGGRLTSLHEYLNLRSRIYMEIDLSARLGLKLEYMWDYRQYSVNNAYQSANHLVAAGISYRISKP